MRKLSILLLVLAFSFLTLAFSPAHKAAAVNVTWNPFQQFTTTTVSTDYDPTMIQSTNGTSWVFWERAPLSTPWAEDIMYQTTNHIGPTMNASAWSPVKTLVSSPAQDVAPNAAQLGNGTVFVSFASNRTGTFQIFLKRYNVATGWSPDLQVTSDNGNQEISTLVAAKDGSLWLFYDSQTSTATNIYYKIYLNGAWTAETALTSDTLPVQNLEPSAHQLSNGQIIVAWSQVQDSHFSKVHIFERIFNGSTWSTRVQLTNSTPDRQPAVTQDANNTVWLIWTREFQITSTTFEDDLVYISSTNGGSTWSSETMLTNDLSCVDPNCYDDIQPSIAQLKDARLYVFWASDRDPASTWNIYYAATNQLPFHNVAVTGVGATPTKLRDGGNVTVTVTVADLGTFTESFQVNVVATNKTSVTIGSQNVTLAPNTSTSLTFSWITGPCSPACPAAPGRYTITASIPPVSGEGVTGDNTMSFSNVWLIPPGDVNMDGRVDIIDAAQAGYAFGSTPGMPNWNTNADIDGDGTVNILDVADVAYWFGTAT